MTDIFTSLFARRSAAFVVLTLAGGLGLDAQTIPATREQPKLLAEATTPKVDLSNFAATTGVTYSPAASSSSSSESSSSSSSDSSVDSARWNLTEVPAEGLQPPPRRSYGRPRYNDNSHNADGSSKYAFEAGIGLTLPTGNTYHYLSTSYGVSIGVGRRFNKNFATFLQFDYDSFGFNGRTLFQQSYLYDPTGTGGLLGNIGGNSHIYSFSIDPTYNFIKGDKFGVYGVVGAGFYHKNATFTTPVTGTAYSYYYGYYQYLANATVDHYNSNAPGFNGGFGITYKPSKFANEEIFAEARYVFVDNQQKTGLNAQNESQYGYNGTPGSGQNPTYSGNNFYPANSNKTTYIPIKFGLRF